VSLALSACVVQPPPGYWNAPASAYPQVPNPSPPYIQGWNTLPTPDAPYSFGPPAPFSAQPAYYGPQSAPIEPQPASWPPQSAAYLPRSGSDNLSEPGNPRTGFADEMVDYGVPPTSTLHLHDFDAPTPLRIGGARTITTIELETMLASTRPPALIDVIGGQQNVTLPHAIWLRDAGVGRHLDDDVQAWFDYKLAQLTGHDKSYPLVFFCASRLCWLAHNATLRALDLGYTNVSWYRGGRDAWQAAGLPMVPVGPPVVDN
jgi:PQQ-dependent catabolism-associated CXXCW motif protein